MLVVEEELELDLPHATARSSEDGGVDDGFGNVFVHVEGGRLERYSTRVKERDPTTVDLSRGSSWMDERHEEEEE